MEFSSSARLSEQLRDKIEEDILTGSFAPGARLDEVQLAEAYGVSRTPIREALLQLGAFGFIARRPRKGWEVAEISPNRLYEMFDVMAELESRMATRRNISVSTNCSTSPSTMPATILS
jgi:DNA-binding GntR family transcriptional regulator